MRAALSRQRWLWLGAAVIGLVAGAAFHLAVPTKVPALTNLYLTQPAAGVSNNLADDVGLLETSAVAEQALKDLHLTAHAALPGSYQASPLGGSILQIEADAGSPSAAVRWANAVAQGFFTVRDQELTDQTDILVKSLHQQEVQLDRQIARLNRDIGALSAGPPGTNTANQIGQLVNQRSGDVSQVGQLQDQAQQDLTALDVTIAGSHVLDAGVAETVSTKKVFAEDGLSGLVAGLAVGMGLVIVGSVISERPRRRSEVAAALGAPVELGLERMRARGFTRRAKLARFVRSPSPELSVVQRRLRAHFEASRDASLAVVPMAGALEPAAISTVALALGLAADARNVVLVDMAEGRPLARILCARPKTGELVPIIASGRSLNLVVMPQDPGSVAAAPLLRDADAVVVLASLSPSFGAGHLVDWVGTSVVMVRAGKANSVLIEAVGEMLREAGLAPKSAIMFGCDKVDETFGAARDQETREPVGPSRGSATTAPVPVTRPVPLPPT